MKLSVEQRFWSKVRKRRSGCWEWLASKNQDGYGKFRYESGIGSTHRISWVLTNGEIPDKLHVLHKCDNPSCVNPDHLFLGTNKDNMIDKMQKGRTADFSGEKNPISKLTDLDVIRIRTLFNSGERTRKELREEYQVSKSLIKMVIDKTTWKHI